MRHAARTDDLERDAMRTQGRVGCWTILGFCALGALTGCSKSPAPPAAETSPAPTADASTAAELADPTANKAAATIDADGLRRDITEISDDRYEGRGPGTRGDEL